ncbi:MAG TPA: hypothetical protein GX510_03380 [Firmicutes bacterium]|nr:hypothetical protein [Candidatus Fermentithermobacillaceae bacterium]
MTVVNFLHISDLHHSNGDDPVLARLRDAIVSDVQQQHTPINYIIFSGDLVESGKAECFESAHQYFVSPLLEGLGLSPDSFLYCPGNHEVDRDAVDSVVRTGLLTLITDRESCNKLSKGAESKVSHYEWLNAYLAYDTNNHQGDSKRKSFGPFHSSYLLPEGIGVVCLNSAWLAWGGDADRGKLVLSEYIIEKAVQSIKDAPIRIAVIHHPFDYLMEEIALSVRKKVQATFDILCTGHIHSPDPSMITGPLNSCFVCGGGALSSQ